ncbi:DUF4392 domain-containing protein [Clostridium saccharobutylicum]|uniref:D-glutamate cyclase-like C-terminal domain-containing protein n=1 Tax=Clostridium saccharobutylicum DSM 13864 TaxID=1345695 RepID=U5MU56_CLOSA|nr:DUF4392 domain-containing protein [Clostridium saccharobutylicum]AGX44058.1 hypothetical protein CLSA_c30920 [Clostridium saccharobutylicum DSM 13864]AQR91350.1 hypothetical protein CLOSC_30750 [Clostridium saccharobutylicum]AQS01254.1 hypothetical protein CSACC_30820 [Clostridium saccharobutylicum]AQS10864.1 hypothetical protein CLOBY_30130 [Clostridium saccharobutylicum]AQS15237.1 hypothetical protein CLOSACC_30820 [Clostridium saccharobutylicum]
MNQKELTLFNIGENLDNLMNLDPRGYGVCRILYSASREYTKEPLTTNAAKKLLDTLKEGDLVYIMTGFVLLPFKKAEMDGIVSSILLARSLVKAFNVKPVIICPEENMLAVKNLSAVVGLHCYDSIEELKEYPISMAAISFTKDASKAEQQADDIMSKGLPSAVISIECPGANSVGKYHNAVGLDVTELEAKQDILFTKLQDKGVLNIAIGDLGNEMGMGTIKEHLEEYIPYAAKGRCNCGCNGGIAVATKADNIITATVSDWGCYGLIAAIAYLKKDLEILHTKEMEEEAMVAASRSGMIDMYGWLTPAIDGFGLSMNLSIVNLMRECVSYAIKLEKTCATWFEKVIELGYYDNVIDTKDSNERLVMLK